MKYAALKYALPFTVLAWATATPARSQIAGVGEPNITSILFRQAAKKPAVLRVVGHFARPDVVESSGVAASIAQPGVFWTINDSGGAPVVYAFDLNGRDLGAFRLSGARNQDWESISVATCERGRGNAKAPSPSIKGWCLIIADAGDNAEKRPTIDLYRIPEPKISVAAALPATLQSAAVPDRIQVTYPDRPHDVEATYVSADGGVHFLTKGWSGTIEHFKVDPGGWKQARPLSARALGRLAVVPDPRTVQLVTDAALSPDGAWLAVRTYRLLYIFPIDPRTGSVLSEPAPTACDIAPPEPEIGEGVAWHPSGSGLILTSEGVAGPIRFVSCTGPTDDATRR